MSLTLHFTPQWGTPLGSTFRAVGSQIPAHDKSILSVRCGENFELWKTSTILERQDHVEFWKQACYSHQQSLTMPHKHTRRGKDLST